MRLLQLWVSGWMIAAAACTAAAGDVSDRAPADPYWSPPAALTAKETGILQFADLALTGSGFYVANFSAIDPPAEPGGRIRTRLRTRTPEGRWIDGPPGEFTFAYPHLTVDAHARLHLLWAEPSETQSGDAFAGILSWSFASLWHATLAAGRWSTPAPLYQGTKLFLDPAQVSPIQRDDEGAPHMAFSALDHPGVPELVHLRLDGSRWAINRIRLRGPPVYVDLNPGADGTVVVSYVFHHQDSLGWHTNTIFVTRSTDGGRTWSEPHPVTTPEQGPAYEPRLARGRGDTLHLVWTQSDVADQNATVALWHASSSDGGASWGNPVSYAISGMTHQLQAAAAPCGGVHVVYSDFSRHTLVYARLSGDAAPVMQTPFPGIAGNPVLRMDDGGTLHLVWTETTVKGPDDSVWHTRLLHSTLRPC